MGGHLNENKLDCIYESTWNLCSTDTPPWGRIPYPKRTRLGYFTEVFPSRVHVFFFFSCTIRLWIRIGPNWMQPRPIHSPTRMKNFIPTGYGLPPPDRVYLAVSLSHHPRRTGAAVGPPEPQPELVCHSCRRPPPGTKCSLTTSRCPASSPRTATLTWAVCSWFSSLSLAAFHACMLYLVHSFSKFEQC